MASPRTMWRAAAAGVLALVTALAGCDQSAHDGAESGTLRLGYFANLTHAEAVEGIFSNALDIAYLGPNPAINAFEKSAGEAIRIIAGATSGGAALRAAAMSPSFRRRTPRRLRPFEPDSFRGHGYRSPGPRGWSRSMPELPEATGPCSTS